VKGHPEVIQVLPDEMLLPPRTDLSLNIPDHGFHRGQGHCAGEAFEGLVVQVVVTVVELLEL
jgi:hypothetical protein